MKASNGSTIRHEVAPLAQNRHVRRNESPSHHPVNGSAVADFTAGQSTAQSPTQQKLSSMRNDRPTSNCPAPTSTICVGNSLPCPRTREGRVRVVATMMASGTFRRGKTARELALAWSISLDAVQLITGEASRLVRSCIDVNELVRTYQEAIDELLVLGHDAKKRGHEREAMFAFTKVAEFCVANMKDRCPDIRDGSSDAEIRKKLLAAGWTPPPFAELPTPTIEDPEAPSLDASNCANAPQ
jgi:hypothetical protein